MQTVHTKQDRLFFQSQPPFMYLTLLYLKGRQPPPPSIPSPISCFQFFYSFPIKLYLCTKISLFIYLFFSIFISPCLSLYLSLSLNSSLFQSLSPSVALLPSLYVNATQSTYSISEPLVAIKSTTQRQPILNYQAKLKL